MRLSRSRSIGLSLLGCSFVFLLGFVPHAFAFTNDQAASLVIGDSSLTSFNPWATLTGLVGPYALTFDSKGNLWVADSDANRILEYDAPFSTGEAASLVIGQSGFTSMGTATTSTSLDTPTGLAFDSGGNLWVVDSFNNRVLEYKAPFSNGEAASVVIGQSNFTGSGSTTTSTGLDSPYGLAFDANDNLWVADLQNGRVLSYSAPFSTGEAASLVIGEPNFVTSNDEVSLKGLNAPAGVAFDSGGNLWVADGHRVLEYLAPFTTHEAASLVIGQNTFTNSSIVATATGLYGPGAIAFDSSHDLWVSDTNNNRVLEYKAPLSTDEAATVVLGQSNFTGSGSNPVFSPTSTTLNHPQGIAFDSSGNLWVADWAEGRVLEYSASGSGGSTTAATSTAATSSTAATTTTTSVVGTAPTTSQTTTSTSSTSGGGGVPVFPYQLATAAIFTVILAVSYLLVRNRTISRGRAGLNGPTSA